MPPESRRATYRRRRRVLVDRDEPGDSEMTMPMHTCPATNTTPRTRSRNFTTLLAALAVLAYAGIADARTAAWTGRMRIDVNFKVLDEGGKVDARVSDRIDIEDQLMDTLLTTKVRFDLGNFGVVLLPGLFLSDSDKKSGIDAYEGLEDDFNDAFPLLTRQTLPGPVAKPKVTVTPATFSSVTPKGKIRVTNKFQKVKLGVTYKVEGTIDGDGEYAGRSFKGKFKVNYKGDRDDG
jgi:hypothetical protein